MTFDEQLRELHDTVRLMATAQKERTDALAQSVELLASIHKDNEKHSEQRAAEGERRAAEGERRMAVFMDTVNRIGRILEAYDLTLDDHEHRLDDLEHPGQ